MHIKLTTLLKEILENIDNLGKPTGEHFTLGSLSDVDDIIDQRGSGILNKSLPVYILTPLDCRKIVGANNKSLLTCFKTADKSSKKLVKQYMAEDLSNEIVVLDGNEMVDGFHRTTAAILSNQNIKTVNLYDA